jgi:Ca2+-transporting ATPase
MTKTGSSDTSRATAPRTRTPVWHSPAAEAVLAHLRVGLDGLAPAEATRRLVEHGRNEVERAASESPWALFWRQINNPLIYVLLGAAALALATGKTLDALVVLGVIIANALIGFLQELRAGKALDALTRLVPDLCAVVRNGQRATIAAAEIVPGDVIALGSGDKVPADARLIQAKSLRVEEAALTGESLPVEKHVDALPEETALGDRRNMVYGGTLVTCGTALAVVVATGGGTELGRISAMLRGTSTVETPLTRKLAGVGKGLTFGISAVAALLFGIALWRGYGATDAMLAAITLAVAAIPEGLPAIITIALAIGVQRMAKRRAVVRHLPAVETLGSTTVICSDKTGTLTRNEMTVQAAWTGRGEVWTVSGVGYAPSGAFEREGQAVPAEQLPDDVAYLIGAGALCNDATLRWEDGAWRITGDPTEAALVTAAGKGDIDAAKFREVWPRLDVIPFESERQFMATLHATGGGTPNLVIMKGAPEVVLARCAELPARVDAAIEAMARQGMRVLAVAILWRDRSDPTLEEEELANLEFAGLLGMIDPPREEAIRAVAECQEAGITVKMITGDHPATATAIARQLGLLAGSPAITGRELEELGDEAARTTNVFARVAPEHKLRLVRALQASGAVVAMTGDGVNDAPAVKQADVGVAMGITGTAVSKESAKVVLVDDNFSSIAAAVEEGRRVYDNLIKALAFVLPTNIGEALIILAAVMFFPFVAGEALLPMLPVQILWINLVATVALALPLAFEAAEPDVMRRKPRDPDAPVFSGFLIFRTVVVAVLMAAGAIGLFLYEFYAARDPGQPFELAVREAQTMAVTTVVFFQIFYLLNCRSLKDSIFKIGLWSNPVVYLGIAALVVLQLMFVYLPWMNAWFSSAPLSLDAWLKCIAAAMIVLPIISIEKRLRRRADH